MNQRHWMEQFDVAITVCDPDGIVLKMNDRAAEIFERQGGKRLVGQNLLDCHPEPARSKLLKMMKDRRKNVYTIEKQGIKKLIYQSPWYVQRPVRWFCRAFAGDSRRHAAFCAGHAIVGCVKRTSSASSLPWCVARTLQLYRSPNSSIRSTSRLATGPAAVAASPACSKTMTNASFGSSAGA